MSYPLLRALSDYINVDIRDMWQGAGNSYGSPEDMPAIYHGPAAAGQEFAGAEAHRLCARRESIPGDINSPYGDQWVCAAGFDGIDVGEPVLSEF